jgi:hypothetical protein
MAKDSLASGARSANFSNSDCKVTQEKWDSIFGEWESEGGAVHIEDEKIAPPAKKIEQKS